MKSILGITDQPKQQTTIVLADGSRAILYLEYRPNQLGWFYDLTAGDFILNGQRIVTHPNLLRQYRNQITFGLAIVTNDNTEPYKQTAFSSDFATLYLLDASDVATIEAQVFSGL